jgi:hypothetical protein
MKKAVYIILMLVCLSCATRPVLEGLSIYKCEGGDIVPTVYAILKRSVMKQLDLVIPGHGYGCAGRYIVSHDTIYAFLNYTYYADTFFLNKDSVPDIFIVKKDSLIHLWNSGIFGPQVERFKRVK